MLLHCQATFLENTHPTFLHKQFQLLLLQHFNLFTSDWLAQYLLYILLDCFGKSFCLWTVPFSRKSSSTLHTDCLLSRPGGLSYFPSKWPKFLFVTFLLLFLSLLLEKWKKSLLNQQPKCTLSPQVLVEFQKLFLWNWRLFFFL